MVCVPILVLTALVTMDAVPFPTTLANLRDSLAASLPEPLGEHIVKMGWDELIMTLYLSYYFILELVAAVCSNHSHSNMLNLICSRL